MSRAYLIGTSIDVPKALLPSIKDMTYCKSRVISPSRASSKLSIPYPSAEEILNCDSNSGSNYGRTSNILKVGIVML